MLNAKMRRNTRQSVEEKLSECRNKHDAQKAKVEQARQALEKLKADGADTDAWFDDEEALGREEKRLKGYESDILTWQGRLADLDEQVAQDALIAEYNAIEAERKEIEKLVASPTLDSLLSTMFREEAFDAKCCLIKKKLPKGYPPITFKRFDPHGDGRGIPLRNIVRDLAKIIERRDLTQARLAQLPPDRNGRFVELNSDLYDELKAALENALRKRRAV